MSLEHELTRALRAEDPGDAFTARVLARVKAEAAAAQGTAPTVPPRALAPVRLNGRQPHAAALESALLFVEAPSTRDGQSTSEKQSTWAEIASSVTTMVNAPVERDVDTDGDVEGEADRQRPPAAPLAWPGARTRTRAGGPPRPADVTAPRRTRARWVWVATMAASLLMSGAGGLQWMKHRQEIAEGERARAEVMAALRLTSAKLSLVRNAVAGSEDTH
jgi:hypothetical protein